MSYLSDLTPVELLENFYKRNLENLKLMRESRNFTYKGLQRQLKTTKQFRDALKKLKQCA